ncbi:Hypothetical protein NGAL_HAMBI2427_02860 [Neorhizobium galegae bv. orientalis]|nr:Hypothetical protein NGAL_HAMBI2427_02860 [Neorhizobium galegae bv. orientalis]
MPHPEPFPLWGGWLAGGRGFDATQVPAPTPPHKGEGLHATLQLTAAMINIFIHRGDLT